MEERDKEVIRHMYVRLLRNLEATNLMGYLYQEHVLGEEDMDKIETKKTTKKKAEKLLKILKKRKNGLKMLIKALLVTEIQAFLGHELLERVTWSEEEMENFSFELEGKLDQRQALLAHVASLQQKNNQLISKLSELELKFTLLKEENLALEDRAQKKKNRHQLFQKLWRSSKHTKSNGEFKSKTEQGCQTDKPLTGGNTNIHDELGVNWTDAGRRWSDPAYAGRLKTKSWGRRRRSLNDSISRSSASFKNAILGVFGKRQQPEERRETDSCSADSWSHSTDLTELS